MKNEIYDELLKIFSSIGMEKGNENGKLSDLNSIEFVEFILSIEEVFGIELPYDLLSQEELQDIEHIALIIETLKDE